MKKIRRIVALLTLVIGMSFLVAAPQVGAVNALATACQADKNVASTQSTVCASQNDNIGTVAGVLVNTLLFLIGLTAVIVIIIGGFTYTSSGGSEEAIKRAKNMILYAVIGLLVALSAYAIVNWVLKLF